MTNTPPKPRLVSTINLKSLKEHKMVFPSKLPYFYQPLSSIQTFYLPMHILKSISQFFRLLQVILFYIKSFSIKTWKTANHFYLHLEVCSASLFSVKSYFYSHEKILLLPVFWDLVINTSIWNTIKVWKWNWILTLQVFPLSQLSCCRTLNECFCCVWHNAGCWALLQCSYFLSHLLPLKYVLHS